MMKTHTTNLVSAFYSCKERLTLGDGGKKYATFIFGGWDAHKAGIGNYDVRRIKTKDP